MEMSKPITTSTGMVQDSPYWLVLCWVKNMMKGHFKASLFLILMVSTLDIKPQLITFMLQGVYLDIVSMIFVEPSPLLTSRSPSTTEIPWQDILQPLQVSTSLYQWTRRARWKPHYRPVCQSYSNLTRLPCTSTSSSLFIFKLTRCSQS